MGAVKRWFEDHIQELTDEELLAMGFKQEQINFLRECFSPKEEDEES